jgi:hypothetical protein
LSSEHGYRRAHRLEQGLSGTGLGFAHQALYFAEGFLDDGLEGR